MRRARGPLIALALAAPSAACGRRGGDAGTAAHSSATGAALVAPAPLSSATRSLALAERRRDAAAVGPSAVDDDDVAVRRAATRALARIGDPARRGDLVRALSDEDPEVAAFAAYGLGWTCKGHEAEHVSALAARAASASASGAPSTAGAGAPTPSGALSAPTPSALAGAPGEGHIVPVIEAIARALGRCASAEAEAVLVSWLGGDPSRAGAAALGLADVASRRAPQDATWVSLLTAAAGGAGHAPIDEALAAFGRRDSLGPSSVVTRLVEVARARLAAGGPWRIFAVRALGRGDDRSVAALAPVLAPGEGYTPAERSEAARSLGRLGEPGRAALAAAIGAMRPGAGPAAQATLVSDLWGPLVSALEALKPPLSAEAKEALKPLADVTLPPTDAPASLGHRVVKLRCAAAAILAERDVTDPRLVACDPEPLGQTGALAEIAVLERRRIEGGRARRLRELLESPHAAVRSAALALLGRHREVEGAEGLLVAALANPHPGTVAAAADAASSRPDLGGGLRRGGGALAAAVVAAIGREYPPDAAETVTALIKAAGVLRAAGARAALDRACAGARPTEREAAAKSLEQLGSGAASCPAVADRAADDPAEGPVAGTPRVELTTDAGELSVTLDPSLAPAAAARFVSLARSGFFDGIAVHRVVPGFVVQFGDRAGDGTGGCAREPLRCETSPARFAPLSVGVALAGRDTGSSQFFVTLARTPHLDGDYALVGTASGDWAAVAEGDRILRARVVE